MSRPSNELQSIYAACDSRSGIKQRVCWRAGRSMHRACRALVVAWGCVGLGKVAVLANNKLVGLTARAQSFQSRSRAARDALHNNARSSVKRKLPLFSLQRVPPTRSLSCSFSLPRLSPTSLFPWLKFFLVRSSVEFSLLRTNHLSLKFAKPVFPPPRYYLIPSS